MGRKSLLLLVLLLVPRPASAQWTFEFAMGNAFSAPTPLTITQTGFPDIHLTAHYETNPLHPRQYYAWRIGRWKDDGGWVLEHVHHKVYLKNVTAEVPDFEVSHGYNLITLNRGWRWGKTMVLAGGGLVVSFPHSEVRGKIYPVKTTGYIWNSGVTAQGAVARRIDLGAHFFVNGEAKLTASWARVPVVDGRATVPNVAVHLLAGAGWQF